MSDYSKVQYNNKTSAFSLVELLVVIALIVLIVSLVIPALGRARDQANVVVCRANLRSLALGCLAYADDHDSVLPTGATVNNPHTDLIDMLGADNYLDIMKTYYCPSETNPELRCSEQNFKAGKISYFYYSFTERPTDRHLSNFLRKTVRWPRILTSTMPSDKWIASDYWFSNAPTAHQYYKKGVNYVTLGATAEMVKDSPRGEFR